MTKPNNDHGLDDLIRELFAYDPDTGAITRKVERGGMPAGSPVGSLESKGGGKRKHLLVNVGRKSLFYHRVAWFLHYDSWPKNTIDHIDRNPLNNRISNLRDADHRIQAQNRASAGAWTGIRLRSGGYNVRIENADGGRICAGTYPSLEVAQKVYAAIKAIIHPGCAHWVEGELTAP